MKEKTKTVIIGIALVLGLLLLIFGFPIYIVYKHNISYDCFEKIAEDVCNERGLIYKSYTYDPLTNRIMCKEDERIRDSQEFVFLEDEIERCWG